MIRLNFLIDSGVIKEMLEGKETSTQALDKFRLMKGRMTPVTTLACLFQGIWTAESCNLEALKSIIDLFEIHVTPETNFKDREAVMNDVIKIAKEMSESGR